MRESFRQAINYNIFAATWRSLEQGYRHIMGVPDPIGGAPVQAGLVLAAAVPILVFAFVSLVGLLEFRANNRNNRQGADQN